MHSIQKTEHSSQNQSKPRKINYKLHKYDIEPEPIKYYPKDITPKVEQLIKNLPFDSMLKIKWRQ